MTISTETQQRAKDIILAGLQAQSHGKVDFTDIRAEPLLDEDDREFLNISVIYEGRREDLVPGLLNSLYQEIKDRLCAAGIQTIPSVSYIDRTEDGERSNAVGTNPLDGKA